MCVCVYLLIVLNWGLPVLQYTSVNEFLLGFLLSDCMCCGYIVRGSREEQAELTQGHP